MTQIFTGSGLGTHNSSLGLGSYGPKGSARLGQGGESVYVNAANGNLVIQQDDGYLADVGVGLGLLHTYNSKGDLRSTWRFNVQSQIELRGTINTVGSTLVRTAEDGHLCFFHYNEQLQKYIPDEGGTEQVIFKNNEWIYKSGDQKSNYHYNQNGQLTKIIDRDGHGFNFSYQDGELSSITDIREKQRITWSFSHGLVQDVTATSEGKVIHHVHYEYNEYQQLHKVSRDLGGGKVYWITYDYVADSQWISDIKQSDGTSLHIDYDAQGRVKCLIDGEGRTSNYSYEQGVTKVTNSLGETWFYYYDDRNRLTAVNGPEHYCIRYYYEGDQLSSVVQGKQIWRFTYNQNGDCIRVEEPTGQIIERLYDDDHQLLQESQYQNFDGTHHPIDKRIKRYLYDEANHLRFAISADGTVTEYRYDNEGRLATARTYLHLFKELISSNKVLTEQELFTWIQQQNAQDINLIEYHYDWRGQPTEEIHYAQIDIHGNGIMQDALITHMLYDAAGRLIEKSIPTDKGWSTTHYFYDDLGRLIEITDNQNHQQKIEYDDLHQRIIQTDANGLRTIKLYDKSGLLLSVHSLDFQKTHGTTTYTYDKAGQLISETDIYGLSTYHFYNALGLEQARVDGLGHISAYQYNEEGLLIKTQQFQHTLSTVGWLNKIPQWSDVQFEASTNDKIEHIIYNQYNQIEYRINSEGAVIGYQYDARGQLISSIAYAQRVKHYIPGQTSFTVTAGSGDRKNSYYYDQAGRLQAKIDSEGYAIEYTYNPVGQLIETCQYARAQVNLLTGTWLTDKPVTRKADIHHYYFYDQRGLKIGEIDGEGYVTEYRYNERGLLKELCVYAEKTSSLEIDPSHSFNEYKPKTHTNDHHTYYQYNDLNQLIEEKTYNGLLTLYSYDEMGNLLSRTRTDIKTQQIRQQQYRYDALGRVVRSLDETGAALLKNPLLSDKEIETIWQSHGIHYEYNEAGLLISKTNALQQKTIYVYDQYARLHYTINADGAIEELTYTAFNQIESVRKYSRFLNVNTEISTDFLEAQIKTLAHPLHDEVTRYEYNSLGQIIAKHTGVKGLVTSDYNAFGELEHSILHIDANHQKMTTYHYDKRGFLTQSIDDEGGFSKNNIMAYDAFGRLSYQIDARGNRREFSFNKRGEQIAIYKESSITTGGFKYISYDAFGRVLYETDYTHSTHIKEYAYDDVANTVTLTHPDNTRVITQFNSFGDKVSSQDANGFTTHFIFDEKGQLTRVEGPEQQSKSYTYNALGQLYFEVDAQGVSIAYTYDAMGHVLTQIKDPQGLNQTTVYTYDAVGRQLTIGSADHRQKSFSYDAQGNLIESRIDPEGLNQITQFKYDDRGLLLRQTQINPLGTNKVIAYEWDVLGRRSATIQDPDGLKLATYYQYDANDNLMCTTDANQHATHFIYDADNQCRYQINPRGVVTEYRYTVNGAVEQTIIYAHPVTALSEYTSTQLVQLLKPDSSHDHYEFNVYDHQGRAIGHYDALGYYTAYTYDGNGNVLSKKAYAIPISLDELKKGIRLVPSPEGARSEYMLYNSANQLRYKCVNGFITEANYNRNGQLISTTRYANKITNFSDDLLDVNQTQQHIQPSTHDRTTCYAYDALGQLTKELSPQGIAKSYDYDALGQVISSTHYATLFNTPTSHDINELQFTAHHQDRTTRHFYDTAGRELYRISSEGRVIERRYDGVNNLIQEIHYTHFFRGEYTLEQIQKLLKNYQPEATHTEYEYDALGKLVSEYRGGSLYEHFDYDAQGNVVKKEQANGAVWTYRYDEANQLIETQSPWVLIGNTKRPVITQSTYDSFGNLISVLRDAEGIKQQLFYEYDSKNQKIKTIYPKTQLNNAGNNSSSQREEQVKDLYEELNYNAFGQVIASSNKAGHWSYCAYNQLGQLTYQINTQKAVTSYEYNAFNEVLRKTRHANTIIYTTSFTTESISRTLFNSVYDRAEAYDYDLEGRVIEANKTAARSYDATTKQYNHSLQPSTHTIYNAFGEPIKISKRINETQWAHTQYYYDNDGKNTAQINAGNYLTTYAYNALGYLESTTDYALAVGHYDQTGYARPQIDPQDRTVSFTYDALGQLKTKTLKNVLVSQKDNAGQYSYIKKDLTTTYSYDALGHLIATIDPQGNNAYCYYNELGQLIAKVEPKTQEGRAATTYTYDALGNLVETRKWANGASEADEHHFKLNAESSNDQSTKQTYDEQGHLLANTNALNHTTYYSYDEQGNVARSWQTSTQIDKSINVQDKRYIYDSEGHLLQTKTFKTATGYSTEDAQYNAFGELSARGINGIYTVHVDYDTQGRVWRSNTQGYYQIYVYDLLDRVTQVVTASNGLLSSPNLADLSSTLFENAWGYDDDAWYWDLQRQNNTYDALGNLSTQSKEFTTIPQGSDKPVVHTLKQQQRFDRWGNMLQFVTNQGLETHYQYNGCDQLIQQELPEVSVMDEQGVLHRLKPTNHYYYDELGRAIGMTDANGHTASKEYDAAGHLIKEMDAKGATRQKHYNLLGQLTSLTNELGGLTTYLYDKENRLILLSTPKTQQYYEYDELGQLIQQTNAANEKTQFWYNAQGQQIKQRTARNQEIQYEYDDAGHKTKETNALGHSQIWNYNNQGLLEEHIDLGGHKTTYRYNANGLIETERSTAGKRINYFYQGDGNLIDYNDLTHNENVHYEYNTEGQLLVRESSRGGDNEGWLREIDYYDYDALGRISQIKRKNPDDKDNRVPLPDKTLFTIGYDYDAVGNIRHTKTKANYTGYNSVQTDDYFLYDENNRMTLNKGTLVDNKISITKTQGNSLVYDAAGNIKQALKYEHEALQQYDYQYNTDNQLELIQKNHRSLQAKSYDAAGRVQREHFFNEAGVVSQKNIMAYDKGLLVSQSTRDQNDNEVSKITYLYDQVDNLADTYLNVVDPNTKKGYSLHHHYIYELWDNYLQKEDKALRTEEGRHYEGKSIRLYDANGLLKESIDTQTGTNGQSNSTKYWNSGVDGIRARTDSGGTTHYLTFGRKTIGDLRLNNMKKQELSVYGGFAPQGSQQKADHGIQTITQFIERSAGDSADGTMPESTQDNIGSYTLQGGDSLESVAFQIYGDSSLWYLIADANGIQGSKSETAQSNGALHIGQRLTIPPVSIGQHHTSATKTVLDDSKMIGNTSATTKIPLPPLPPPLPKHHNHLFAKIVVGIIATVATVLTAGIVGAIAGASAAGSGLFALGTSILSGGVLGTAGTLAAGFTAGFLGNLASQSAATALKLQEGINVKGALISGLISAASAGILKGAGNKELISKLSNEKLNPYFNLTSAAEAMEYNVTNQSIGLITNQQKHFDWEQLGISTVTAGLLANGASQNLKETLKKIDFNRGILASEMEALARSAVSTAAGADFNPAMALTDNLGAAIGDSIIDEPAEKEVKGDQIELEATEFSTLAELHSAINTKCNSKIDFEAFATFEGKQSKSGYLPLTEQKVKGKRTIVVAGESGITIATAFDIGQRSKSDIKKLKFSEALEKKLLPFAGKKKNEALAILPQAKKTILTQKEANEIDFKIIPNFIEDTKNSWDKRRLINTPKFENLTSSQQTVLLSRTYQQGGKMPETQVAQKFYKAALNNDWVAAEKYLDKYNVSARYYIDRVHKEYLFLKKHRELDESRSN